MIQSLQKFDFAQGCDWKAILFVVNEYLLQRDDLACFLGSCLGYFSERALSQLANPFVLLNFGASVKP